MKNIKVIKPKPGQESVWDYPRPPMVMEVKDDISICHHNRMICRSSNSFRVLETSHPPTFYIPMNAFRDVELKLNKRNSFCEFKGMATYVDLHFEDGIIEDVGWTYLNPSKGFEKITKAISIYASKVDQCKVGNRFVQAQEGDFYGGWITENIVGPFKGGPGTWGW